jgi:hypothetical protein
LGAINLLPELTLLRRVIYIGKEYLYSEKKSSFGEEDLIGNKPLI